MKYLLLLLSSLLCLPLIGENNSSLLYTTRAVVIGISDYQDEHIEDLDNRASMALAFAAYLKSNTGGQVADENLRLLINEKATTGQIQSAVDWLTTSESKGNRVIFYFAGYGDLQNMAPYDVPALAFATHSFPFSPVRKLLTKLERTNMTEVMIILDVQPFEASNHKSVQQQVASISKDETEAINEMYISTSLTKALHNKNKKAKLNRGMTDLLLEALLGRGDYNDNQVISLSETRRYMLAHLDDYIHFSSQLYIYANTFLKPLAVVDKKMLNKLNKDSFNILPPLVYIESDEFENALLKKEPKKVRDLYQDFVVALRLGNFLVPIELSANTRYEELLQEDISKSLRKTIKRKYVASLQDESQQAINSYLKSDPGELVLRWKYSEKYANFPLYLEKAAALVGEHHFMYNHLRAKQYYFEGISIRLDASKKKEFKRSYELALLKQKLAMEYEDEAAFIYNEIGLLYYLSGKYDEAIGYYLKAIHLSPRWSIPHSNIAIAYAALEDLKAAEKYCKKAVEINPDYSAAYNNLGTIYLKSSLYDLAESNFKKAIQLFPEAPLPYYNMTCSKAMQGKNGKACKWMERALKKGFDRFEYLHKDPDLENIRNSKRFNKLIQKYTLDE